MKDIDLWQGDCLELMNNISDKSVDMILTDLPYGSTNCKWDCEIDLDKLWQQYMRIIKDNGCIALWSQAPFSHRLAMSNIANYRYEWIIEKTKATGHLNAKKMPMKAHETVQIFYKKLPTYNPQMTNGHAPVHSYTKHTDDGNCYGKTKAGISGGGSTLRYPRDILTFKWDTQKSSLHECQKPVDSCEYFIKTYTNPGDVVLDSCMGSGTTGVAAKNLGRNFIGIEKEQKYFEIAKNRLKS
jgi:site-specific DNA-methyltransferase (adenine-specific)